MLYRMSGTVLSDEYARYYRWFDDSIDIICPADVRNIIETAPDGEPIVFGLNSYGGHVQAGQEIYSIFEDAKRRGKEIIVEVQSIAASAASLLMLGASKVRISAPAQVMIHRAALGAEGNVDELGKAIEQLNSTDRAMLEAYARKCGDKTTKNELFRMMKKETFLTAPEALKIGLVDEIIGSMEESSPLLLVASVNMQRGIRMGASTLPDINEVIAAYRAAHKIQDNDLQGNGSLYISNGVAYENTGLKAVDYNVKIYETSTSISAPAQLEQDDKWRESAKRWISVRK